MLTNQLNQLLSSLHIDLPNGIQSPSDLTPSLLLAILESLLSTRLPISPNLRRSKDHESKMKIFLGVLGTDILKSDNMGISTVDPRRLARGEWAEVVHVAEVLCWIGRTLGHIQDDSERGTSPATTTTATKTLSGASTSESVPTTVDDDDENHQLPPFRAPRCIHEVPSPLVALSPTLHVDRWEDQSSSNNLLLSLDTKISPPVRYDGLISPVDQDWEINSFESGCASSSSNNIFDEPQRKVCSLFRVSVIFYPKILRTLFARIIMHTRLHFSKKERDFWRR